MFKNHKHKIIAIAILILLIAGTVRYVNYLINKPLDIPIPKHFTYNGQKIALAWTDDNTGENLIIQSDKKEYNGFSSVDVYFSITNITKRNQEVDIKFIGDHINLINPCQRIADNSAGIDMIYMIKSGETNYYKATLGFAPMSKGEFFIEAIGNKGGYGLLDPWYSSSWKYRKEITINSSQVTAHLTDFPVLATTTDTDLKSAANGGKVALSTGYDIVFADTGGNVLNYEREKYDSATGEIAYWIKTDISSTTDKTIYMYYGNSGASDLATTTGVWDDNYVGVWHLPDDETASTTDSTKYDNDGSAVATASSTPSGQIDGGFLFDGDSDYVDVENNSSLQITGFLTISAWINPDALSTKQAIVDKGESAGADGYRFIVSDTSSAALELVSGYYFSGGSSITSTNVLTNGEQCHVVGVIAGANSKIYHNSQVVASGSLNALLASDNNLKIGYKSEPSSSITYFSGLMDEFRISNVVRTAQWIETEYNNQVSVGSFMTIGAEESSALSKVNSPLTNKLTDGLVGHWTFNGADMDWASTTAEALDRSGNSNNGNVIGATPAIGKVGQGLDFDGVGDYVKVEDSSSLDITDNITITAWIYVTKDTNNPIVTKLTEGSNPYRFMWDSDERLAFQADFDGVWVSTHRSSVWLDFNEWYHAVVTYSGAEIVFYANGNAITTINETGVLTSNNEPVEIGKSTTNSYNFNGLIDEVRVYNRALSADEIGELYRAGAKRLGVNTTQVNKLTDGLVGHWTFNGADMDWASTTAEALDRSGNSNNGNVIGAKAAIGKVGQGMEFDGVDDYVDVPDADSLDATNVTLSAWVKSGTVGRYIIAKDPPGLINSKSQITNNNNQNIFEKTFDFVKQKIVDFVNGTRKVLSWFGATIITEDEFKEIYKNVYGYDLVPWQKADGTDMSPLVAVLDDNNEQVIKPNGKPLLERSNLIPQWEQEFNNNKEKGELNKVLEELKDNTPSKFNLALSGKLFFAGIINKFFNAIAEIVLAAVEVSDTFTEASDTALESHTPDTGTGYTEVIDTGTCALWIYTSVDRLSGSASNSFGSCFSGQGSLCSEDTALSSANYEVSVLQQDGDTGDDTNTIACRIQDVNNMYAVRFNEDASDLYKRTTANGWETIDTSGGGIADGSTVKLICDGTSISVEDDDVEILSATDSSHAAAGKAGIGMGTVMVAGDDCSSQDLDNFTVNTLPASGKSSVPYALSTVGGGQFLIMNSGTTYTATSTTDINDNEWHHIVGSYDGTTMKVYIDGVLEDTNTDFSGNLPTNSGNVRIGADYQTTAANFFDGLIDEARIYNRALSADEIGELYRAGARKMRLKR